MDFNVKKLVKDAGTAISRVVQYTEEKLGTSEKTELDSQFEHLSERSDCTKKWTEKIVKDTEAVLTPNPGDRVEDFLLEKIEKKRPNRLSNLEYLGLDMIEAGNEIGSGTSYGSTLIMVGQCEQRLGSIERDFTNSAMQGFVGPLHTFLDGEMKTIQRERSILESKRLDLDVCKNRVRKARSLLGTPNRDGVTAEQLLEQAEQDLRCAQIQFDRQAEITKLLLEGVSSSHAAHLRCLTEFVNAQTTYYAQCHERMQQLQKELAKSITTIADSSDTGDRQFKYRAKVICDYDACKPSELSLIAGEVILVEASDSCEDYVMVKRGTQMGKVPKAFLDIQNS